MAQNTSDPILMIYLKIVLTKLKAAGFKINAEKSFFARDNLEYLGFKITQQGIILPHLENVQAIKHITVPTNKKNYRSSKFLQRYLETHIRYLNSFT